MKKLFPLLLSYVLMSTQCYAISGGPTYGGGSSVNVIGSYSGTILGTSQSSTDQGPAIPGEAPGTAADSNSTASNALGLFDLTVPGVSTATGAFVLFASGRVFGGTISASVDPDTAKLSGILDGSFNFTETTFDSTGAATATAVTASAVGSINATIRATGVSSFTTARLTGSAFLEVNFGQIDTNTLAPVIAQTIIFTVSGFQQTSTAAAASTVSSLTTLTGGATGSGGAGG